jgi:hypothetical protein
LGTGSFLLQQVRHRKDDQSWQELLARFSRRPIAFLLANGFAQSDAASVSAEVAAKVRQRIEAVDVFPHPASRWLHRLMHHTWRETLGELPGRPTGASVQPLGNPLEAELSTCDEDPLALRVIANARRRLQANGRTTAARDLRIFQSYLLANASVQAIASREHVSVVEVKLISARVKKLLDEEKSRLMGEDQ